MAGSGAPTSEPAAGLLRGLLGLLLLAVTCLVLALAFVGFSLLFGCNGLVLAVLAQVRVRLARRAPVPYVGHGPPAVTELVPVVPDRTVGRVAGDRPGPSGFTTARPARSGPGERWQFRSGQRWKWRRPQEASSMKRPWSLRRVALSRSLFHT